jgi:transcriptional regulator with GAF, ATPase, and Fis domain
MADAAWFMRNEPVEDVAGAGVPEAISEDDDRSTAVRDEDDQDTSNEGIAGCSAALRAVLAGVAKVAQTEATVLITGETGTGKELIAHAIHRRSARSRRPMVSVNCAAIPAPLIASELFGHERGAFTGAAQRRLGRFEVATGGTIFLDEVGELPLETQIALLRVLQEREFERVGGTTTIRPDVRVVAATNRDLEGAIAEGTFRTDLYYRLNVFPLELPPLRERREDIRPLVELFLERYARRARERIRRISNRTLALLEAYPWPGNIRELQNVIERSVIMCKSEILSVDERWLSPGGPRQHPLHQVPHLSAIPNTAPRVHEPISSTGTLEEIQRQAILRALRSANWTVGGANGAAARLGLKRTTLQACMRRLGIAPPRVSRAAGDSSAVAPRGDTLGSRTRVQRPAAHSRTP